MSLTKQEAKSDSPTWNKKQPTEFLRIIEVKILAEYVRDLLDDKIKRLQKKLHLHGFRKGKVPVSIIRQRFYDALLQETATQLIDANTPTVTGHESVDIKTVTDEGVIKNVKISEATGLTYEIHFKTCASVVDMRKPEPTVGNGSVVDLTKPPAPAQAPAPAVPSFAKRKG